MTTVLREMRPFATKITPAEINVLVSDNGWVGTDKTTVRNALNAALYAGVDVLGYERFRLPAEYVAACIAISCKEVNWKSACIYMADSKLNELDVLAGYQEEREQVNAERLFALVLECKAASGQFNIELETAFSEARALVEEGEV